MSTRPERCPKCKSGNTTMDEKWWLCGSCGHTWHTPEPSAPAPDDVKQRSTKDLVEWIAQIAHDNGDWGYIKDEIMRRTAAPEAGGAEPMSAENYWYTFPLEDYPFRNDDQLALIFKFADDFAAYVVTTKLNGEIIKLRQRIRELEGK